MKLTGTEWYCKFTAEVGTFTAEQAAEFLDGSKLYAYMVAAAKRASGVSE